jgi:hypothetical protein
MVLVFPAPRMETLSIRPVTNQSGRLLVVWPTTVHAILASPRLPKSLEDDAGRGRIGYHSLSSTRVLPLTSLPAWRSKTYRLSVNSLVKDS